jgi:hypothetical protein
MYWGRLGIVEDVRITKAMIAYKTGVLDAKASGERAAALALDIGYACRDLTLAAWQIRLPSSVELIPR